MQTKELNNLIFIRLFPGEEVMESLEQACKKYQLKTAVVLSGLGQLADFELGFFKEKGNYLPEKFVQPYELLSLTGSISCQGPACDFHLHSVLGNDKKKPVGGHFIRGKVNVTGEIVLLKSDLSVIRKIEEPTGLKGLFLN